MPFGHNSIFFYVIIIDWIEGLTRGPPGDQSLPEPIVIYNLNAATHFEA